MPPAQANGPTQSQIQETLALYQTQRFAEAEALLATLTQKFPNHPFAWKALGLILNLTGRNLAALYPMQQAVRLNPGDSEAIRNLGIVLYSLGRIEESGATFQKAIRLEPHHAETHCNLGNVFKVLGQLKASEASYRNAIRIRPEYAAGLCNLGVTLYDSGQFTASVAFYQKAIKIDPLNAIAHNNAANALKEHGSLEASERFYRNAICLEPSYAEAYSNRGVALKDLESIEDAERSYRRAIKLNPDLTNAYSNLLFLISCLKDTPSTEYLELASTFGHVVSDKAIMKHVQWTMPDESKKLRVGFVSGDLRNHPVGYFLEGLCTRIDASRIALVAFPTCPKEDDLTLRIKEQLTGWFPIFGLQDKEASAFIHDQQIHILIDLSGHTADNRLGVFAYKPAPIQATWLGYWASTGVEAIDYLIGDPVVTPKEQDHHFKEKVWRLPKTRFCFTPPGDEIEIDDAAFVRNGYVTFGCFNNLVKLTRPVILTWARILCALPSAKLHLKTDRLSQAAIRTVISARFESVGVSSDRLILEGPSSRSNYLCAYNQIDIALDPFPYPGGTTSCEALWMGVPVLTHKGHHLISRQGEGILKSCDLAEWIADNQDDYVQKAIDFAANPKALVKTKKNLRQRVMASPLFNSSEFASHFGHAMMAMWDQHKTSKALEGQILSLQQKRETE